MAGRNISTPAVLIAAGGAALLWSAIKGVAPASGLRSLLGGHVPTGNVGDAAGLIGQSAANAAGTAEEPSPRPDPGATATGSAIASAAMAYQGKGVYRWAGAKPSGWDCSGFVNWVIGHDLNRPITGFPHGGFTGAWHGPATAQWAITRLCYNIKRSEVAAGDLIVWPARHMGIAISNQQMINCPGPNGTVAPVLHSIDERLGPVVYRRYRG